MGSAGLGFDASVSKHLEASVAYGWQFLEQGFDDGESGRFHIQVTTRW